jgi:hypothetical protein
VNVELPKTAVSTIHGSRSSRLEAGISDDDYTEYTRVLKATQQARAAAEAIVVATNSLKSVLQPPVPATGRHAVRSMIAKIPGTRKVYHAVRGHGRSH